MTSEATRPVDTGTPPRSERKRLKGRRGASEDTPKRKKPRGCRRCWALVQTPFDRCPCCGGSLVDAVKWKGSAPGRARVWVKRERAS